MSSATGGFGGGATGGAPGGSPADGAADGTPTCTYSGNDAPDGSTFSSVCPQAGCPTGTVCVVEIGGIAGGGGEYCAPIPNECHGQPSCACMAACVCTNGFGNRPEACSDESGGIACDNGVR